MKRLVAIVIILLWSVNAFAAVKWVNSYYRRDDTKVSGHYRDTSNDGVEWNNVNYYKDNGYW